MPSVNKWKRTEGSHLELEARPLKRKNNTVVVVLADDLVKPQKDRALLEKSSKGKGKGKAGKGIGPSADKPPSPSSLKSLISYLFLYDETKVKKPAVGAFSSLEELFREEVVKGEDVGHHFFRHGCHGSSLFAFSYGCWLSPYVVSLFLCFVTLLVFTVVV